MEETDFMQKVRNSNIEMLRILAMLAIIAGHMTHQTEVLNCTSGSQLLLSYIAGSGHRIGVNLFLLIGTWFLVESSFKAERILKLYGQMAFYTISISVVILLLDLPHSDVDIIRCFMPFTLRPVWFGSAYIAMLLLIPFMNHIPQSGGGKFMVMILFVLISAFSTITPKMWDNYICSFVWFAFIYLAMRQLKTSIQSFHANKWVVLSLGFFLYIVLAYGEFKDVPIAKQYIDDFKSVPNLLISLCIFYFFIRLDVKTSKCINWFAGSAFAVYIVHQTPNFYEILWNKVYQVSSWIGSDWFILYLFTYVLLTYIWIVLFDQVRKKLLEPIWVNSHVYSFFCRRIADSYKELSSPKTNA